jgi:hypothetical protein
MIGLKSKGTAMTATKDRKANITLGISGLSLLVAGIAVFFTADTRFDFFGAKKPRLVACQPVRRFVEKPIIMPAPVLIRGAPPDRLDSYVPSSEIPEQPAAGTSTIISYENLGPGETLFLYAEFRVADHYKSMPRPMRYRDDVTVKAVGDDEVRTVQATSYRMGVPIPIMFSLTDCDPIVGILRYDLPTPAATPGGDQFTFLDVRIIAPKGGGWTAKGTLTLHFANATPLSYENVELDTFVNASR